MSTLLLELWNSGTLEKFSVASCTPIDSGDVPVWLTRLRMTVFITVLILALMQYRYREKEREQACLPDLRRAARLLNYQRH